MSICGHMALAFAPSDEASAIATFNSQDAPDSADWLKASLSYGAIEEYWGELNQVLQLLAEHDPSLEPLSYAIIGKRSIGEGPGTDYFLYKPDEVEAMADAFRRVSDSALENSIADVVARDPWYQSIDSRSFQQAIKSSFHSVADELSKVAASGWSMIGFMF